MTSTAVALTKAFRDGTPLTYQPPRDTLDERYLRCAVHRVGCDCWEAERNEQLNELRGELKAWDEAARRILAGHPVDAWTADGTGQLGCMCTGCQLVRAVFSRVRYVNVDKHDGADVVIIRAAS